MQNPDGVIKPQTTKPEIVKMLLRGKRPSELSRVYNVGLVYKTYNELVESKLLPPKDSADTAPPSKDDDKQQDDDLFQVDSDGNEKPPAVRSYSTTPLNVSSWGKDKGDTVSKGVDTVNLDGQPTLPYEAVERIRNIMGISARPKVLNMPMPEMLYPAMVIAVTEMDFPPMRPEDFIDTVIYQWLEAAGYIPRAYIKRSELEKLIEKPTPEQENNKFKEWAKERGLITPDEVINAIATKLNVPAEKIVDLFSNVGGDGDGHGDGHNGNGHTEQPEPVVAATSQEVSPADAGGNATQNDASVVIDESAKNDMTINPKNDIVQVTQEVNSQLPEKPPEPVSKDLITREQVARLFAIAHGLSDVDGQIIDLITRGKSRSEIGMKCGISSSAIFGKSSQFVRKLKVHNMQDVLTIYREFLGEYNVL